MRAAVRDNTKAIFVESLGNPNSNVADLEKLAEIAHRHKIPLVVDSTFATPYLLRPIEYGADIVVHSATKFIGGHGTALGGVIVEGGNFDWKDSGKYPWISDPNPSYHGVSFADAAPESAFVTYVRAVLLRDTGGSTVTLPCISSAQGLETLSLRVERHVEKCVESGEISGRAPDGGGSPPPRLLRARQPMRCMRNTFRTEAVPSLRLRFKGDAETARNFIDHLPIFSLLANVADVKSLVIHPATTTHSQCTPEELRSRESGPTPSVFLSG